MDKTGEQRKRRRAALFFRTGSILVCLFLLLVMAGGCAVRSKMMAGLSQTIVDNDDLAMVEAGAPAYLLMIDSLIKEDPDSEELLSTAALLNTAYAQVFVQDARRAGKIAAKALGYAERALCISDPRACGLRDRPYETFTVAIESMGAEDIRALFSLGRAWAGWIMANKDDFNALADLSRIEDIMLRVTRLDESFRDGAAFLYLGTLATFLPPALGGRPEDGRAYFEKALSLSKGKNLMAKVMFAKLYARMMFDRELHDRLLNEVLATDPAVPGHTLVNTWARDQARLLLEEADDYF